MCFDIYHHISVMELGHLLTRSGLTFDIYIYIYIYLWDEDALLTTLLIVGYKGSVSIWCYGTILTEGPATGHLGTGFSWFPCVYKQMLRWFPRFQVATTCFSCSPPVLNLVLTIFVFVLTIFMFADM